MMFRKIALAALAVTALGGQIAHAKPCRDEKGKFTKCEAPARPKPCRDKQGKFTKCVPPTAASAATPSTPGPAAAPATGMTSTPPATPGH